MTDELDDAIHDDDGIDDVEETDETTVEPEGDDTTVDPCAAHEGKPCTPQGHGFGPEVQDIDGRLVDTSVREVEPLS